MKLVAAFAVALGLVLAVWAVIPSASPGEPPFYRILGVIVGLTCILNGVQAWRGSDR